MIPALSSSLLTVGIYGLPASEVYLPEDMLAIPIRSASNLHARA